MCAGTLQVALRSTVGQPGLGTGPESGWPLVPERVGWVLWLRTGEAQLEQPVETSGWGAGPPWG